MRVLMSLFLVAGIVQPALADDRKPQLCLDNRTINESRFSRDEGYFAKNGPGWWQNKMRGCNLLAPNRAIKTLSTINRQCSGDQLVVFDNFSQIEFGVCVLEQWEPVADTAVPEPKNRPEPGSR